MLNTHVIELGVRNPKETKKEYLGSWWSRICCRPQLEMRRKFHVGDTITLVENPALEPLPGYKRKKPVLFTGFYPIDTRDYAELKKSLDKISLSDSSLTWEQETSKGSWIWL